MQEKDTLRILLATDNHVGYAERDPVRGNDSLVTFEEILRHAEHQQVDMVLLGGDLFHDNKPSRKSLHGTIEIFRRFCMGDRPCGIQFLSSPAENFKHQSFPEVNYMSPNHNISIPVFSIHGNHDDPAGDGTLSAMDILSVNGLVNYFGRVYNVEDIEVSPILLQKGKTKLALYGIGHVRDERLHKAFTKEKVKMLRPSNDPESWFNILVLHQNRRKRGQADFIPEQYLADFLDLVVWGHEHDCQIDPAPHDTHRFYLSQPGSSIATSLAEGEAIKKHIALIEIHERAFKFTKIPLDTVRTFLFDHISLSNSGIHPSQEDQIVAYLTAKVDQMITAAQEEIAASETELKPRLPLIRLRVEYSGGYEVVNPLRFGQIYVNRVANPRELLNFYRQKRTYASKRGDNDVDGSGIMQERPRAVETTTVTDFIELKERDKMGILSEYMMKEAVSAYVDKDEREAIIEFVTYSVQSTQEYLKKNRATEESIVQQLAMRKKHLQRDEEEKLASEALKRAQEKRQSGAVEVETKQSDDNDSDEAGAPVGSAASGRGSRSRGRPRGSRSAAGQKGAGRGRGRGRGRGKGQGSSSNVRLSSDVVHVSDSDEEIQQISASFSAARSSSRSTPSWSQIEKGSRKRGAIAYVESDDLSANPFVIAKRKK
ncbi:double-strand break repair protein MRE11-like isoform X2 [Corticium candelabrum]|uniref:double-strand break repair protein MRE11-like isoform X2 n=1 Tax=Corticium candelabrum TaxID=121492 RepID=UPI002E25F861|nr:double-strand break repair protein MRE11-like isoform X2 [Corticium candelabrum]